VERFSDCLGKLFCAISSDGSAELEPAAAVSKPVNLPVGSGAEPRSFSMVATSNIALAIDIETGGDGIDVPDKLAPTMAAVPNVSDASTNVATGPPTSSASCLPLAVLARIEANKQAALQRRKAAEDAADIKRPNESGVRSANGALVTLSHDSGRSPAASVLLPSLEQSDANQTKCPIKRHWGALGAVSDDGDD
jgi:hypothetical protein